MRADRRSLRDWLPVSATALFCLLTTLVLVFELPPAVRDYRASERALAAQAERHRAVYGQIREHRRTVLSLIRDPQRQELALDEKGRIPAHEPDER